MSAKRQLAQLQPIGRRNRLRRGLWEIVWATLYRPSPVFAHRWRALLLRLFGATLEWPVYPYPKARIWAPWNLVMRRGSCIANDVDCYNVARVLLGNGVTISQKTHLCTASHDYNDPKFPLIGAPIVIGDGAWVAAEAFVGPGVSIGDRAVVLARSVIVKNVEPSSVMGGNPARHLHDRALNAFTIPGDGTT